jgi:hypothetical protein
MKTGVGERNIPDLSASLNRLKLAYAYKRRSRGTQSKRYLSENVPALSTFTNGSWGAAHNCSFWDTITALPVPN